MSDIVEELRSRTTGVVLLSDPPQFQKDDLCQRAADEIERLREENAGLREELQKEFNAMRVFARYRELEAEIETLRAALKPFVPKTQVIDAAIPDTRPIDVMVRAGELRAAVAALKENGDE